ncbi:MAG TPA: hypothetical protein VJU86_12520 [Pyrinomonadaceae bacterium]|nr:hypothetical protein [Pyrinomonadaceae bacterium]
MIEKKVFAERPFGSVPEHILIMCGVVVLWFGNSFLREPLPPKVLILIFGGGYVLFFLVSGLSRNLTITCDSLGCDVQSKFFWQRAGKDFSFKWAEVTETKFKRARVSSTTAMFFWVVASGEPRRLLRRDWFAADTLEDFVALVNESTPHLPYVWVKDALAPNVIDKVGQFRKVRRVAA